MSCVFERHQVSGRRDSFWLLGFDEKPAQRVAPCCCQAFFALRRPFICLLRASYQIYHSSGDTFPHCIKLARPALTLFPCSRSNLGAAFILRDDLALQFSWLVD